MDFFRRTPEHDILPMDFRSSPENGHSRYGNRTARFAPNRTRDGVQHGKGPPVNQHWLERILFDHFVGASAQRRPNFEA